MKVIYMEPTLRLIAMSYPEALEAIEFEGKMKQTENVRYIVVEDGENG
jgi:hypothetical protein